MRKSSGDMRIGVVVIHFIIIKTAQNIVEIVGHVATPKEMEHMIASAPKIKPNIVVKIVQNVEDNQNAPYAQSVNFYQPLCQLTRGRSRIRLSRMWVERKYSSGQKLE